MTAATAVALTVAAYPEIDRDEVRRRVSAEATALPALPTALAKVQRAPKRALRRLGR